MVTIWLIKAGYSLEHICPSTPRTPEVGDVEFGDFVLLKKEAEGESEVEKKVDWALLFSETPKTKLLEKLEQQQKEEETPSVLWQPRSREGDWLDVSGGPVLRKFGKM